MTMTYQEIINFWFDEIESKLWWIKDTAFDTEIGQRFGAIHAAALRCECYRWRVHPLGRLAEIIVLDQFSRNIYRDQPLAFANDSLSLALAQEAVVAGGQNTHYNTKGLSIHALHAQRIRSDP